MDMILLFLFVGCVTGFFAGLLGIGGGAIIVPVVMYVVSQQAIPTDMVMKIALSTSFSVIIFSTASSAYSHHKRKAILWDQFPLLAIGTLLGMLVGTFFFLYKKMSKYNITNRVLHFHDLYHLWIINKKERN
ncbi:sulfite exporter TauE/SafE family protein [Shigella sp. FC1967]|uniref:sulfite exporter TauE/SafE family protein n=1 Tax=Shigella sp. FC1967 TaxID=1898041 RepID=UPI000B22A349|nr:sulfite exporter TauE/SafE family protein [Shigella sp. FC1967]